MEIETSAVGEKKGMEQSASIERLWNPVISIFIRQD
jgi:hypothetical protein